MTELTRHPLYAATDALLAALSAEGFILSDRNRARELEASDRSFACFRETETAQPSPITAYNGAYQLRPRLLPGYLEELNGSVPLRAAAYGRIYDRSGEDLPAFQRVEGVISAPELPLRDRKKLWSHILQQVLGLSVTVSVTVKEKDYYEITADDTVVGGTGPASWLARSVLGAPGDLAVDAFCLDVDAIAQLYADLPDRKALYDTTADGIPCKCASFADHYTAKAADVLRARGYREFSGMKLYPDGIYKKMNMIQASWDTNNVGVTLDDPLGDGTGLPTVLTPSLEQCMADNLRKGRTSVKVFEIGHIYKPSPAGAPSDRLSLSIGASDPDLDFRSFVKEMDAILSELGISNHFFFPTNMAIAYNTSECMIVLDEKTQYLDGNFGGISPIAEENFGISQHAFMAQFELPTLERKADEEYNFIPPESL